MRPPRRQRKVTTPSTVQEREARRYHTCPECEACFHLVDGKLPPHRAFKNSDAYCPASDCVVSSAR
jgi:hypothetical protein